MGDYMNRLAQWPQATRTISCQVASSDFRTAFSSCKHKNWQVTMALPLQPGLTPMEVAFLCEMEMVTVVPRQRLESLNLLGVSSDPANPTIALSQV
jgi:hypothetical protein